MKVIEEFETIQGEGRYVGVPSYFIRSTGCNLRCAWRNPDNSVTICDTPYSSFNPEKGKDLDVQGTINKLEKTAINNIVITGGEPTLNNDLPDIVREFGDAGYFVTVETNGTKYHNMSSAFMSISPKLKSSYSAEGMDLLTHTANNQWIYTTREWIHNNDYQLKFVGNDKTDLVEILKTQNALEVPSDKIYIMPQGITTEQFKERENMLVEFCIKNGFNYSPRLHIDIWGNVRGK